MADIVAIIPCYNGAAFVGGAIESALAQTRPVSRVIVVDDASVDGSREVAQAYADAGHPVTVITSPTNEGPATARNMAIAATSEPLLAFLDADDRWDAEHCEVLYSVLDRHPEAGIAFSHARKVRKHGDMRPCEIGEGDRRRRTHCEQVLARLLHFNPVPQSAAMVRRAALAQAGGYRDGFRFGEDYELWLRLAHCGAFAWTDAITCTRLSHTGQASRNALAMYQGAWSARASYRAFALEAVPVIDREASRAAYISAYERDMGEAWRSRSWGTFLGVWRLGSEIPGMQGVRRRWTIRMPFWPVWRSVAFCWDMYSRSAWDGGRRSTAHMVVDRGWKPVTARDGQLTPPFKPVEG